MEAETLKTEHEVLVDLLKLSGEFDDIVFDYDYKLPYLNKASYIGIKEKIERSYDLKASTTEKLYFIISQYERILENEY